MFRAEGQASTGRRLRHLRPADRPGADPRRWNPHVHPQPGHRRVLPDQRLHVKIPEDTSEFAINTSNFRRWDGHIRAYVDDCLKGAEGPHGKNYNTRWIASLVAECHRIMMRGGIFLYPGDRRPDYHKGRLRLAYECNPIAFLVEQAGGAASTGHEAHPGRASRRTSTSARR